MRETYAHKYSQLQRGRNTGSDKGSDKGSERKKYIDRKSESESESESELDRSVCPERDASKRKAVRDSQTDIESMRASHADRDKQIGRQSER